MTNFLFHKISEKERAEIQAQAKRIVENFSKELDKVKVKVIEKDDETGNGQRIEDSEKCNEINRKIMFENAPDKNADFIIAERKKW